MHSITKECNKQTGRNQDVNAITGQKLSDCIYKP